MKPLKAERRKTIIIRSWYPSMESCEAGTKIPKSLQQSAKAAGCDAFPANGRVNTGALLHWIFGKGIQGDEIDWDALNTELDAKLKQLKLERELGTAISLDEAQELVQQLMGLLMGSVKRMAVEFPKTLEMRDATYIKSQCDQIYRDILRRAAAEIEKLKGTK